MAAIQESDREEPQEWHILLREIEHRQGQWVRLWGPAPIQSRHWIQERAHYIRKHYERHDAKFRTRRQDGQLVGELWAVYMDDGQVDDKADRKGKYGR